jgi:sec-independent protein translocase protein TatA
MIEGVVPLFPGLPGGPELLIVLFVLVLLFGANKIPKLARSTGQAMGEFQKGRQEIEEELEEMEEEVTPGEESARAPAGSTTTTDETETETETTSDSGSSSN